MDLKRISPDFTVSPQLTVPDIAAVANLGFKAIINNRPDGESPDQPSAAEIEAEARAQGLEYRYIPVIGSQIGEAEIDALAQATAELDGPVLAYCRSGTRSAMLWALSEAGRTSSDALIAAAGEAGYDLSGLRPLLDGRRVEPATLTASNAGSKAEEKAQDKPDASPVRHFDVVVVGGGAGGLSAAASLLKRRPSLNLAVVEPRKTHYYQPGWTLVGGGVFDLEQTCRPMPGLMPNSATWIHGAAAGFDPAHNTVMLEDGSRLTYDVLIAAPGLKLDLDGVDGLSAALGSNGVTSNYLFDHAPYTWKTVDALRRGTALFTQPPMPIKCAGAPQKAMYLSCDAWSRAGVLKDIDVQFHNAGPGLFGVPEYVPALMDYVKRYDIGLNFGSKLVAVDGPSRTAIFEQAGKDGPVRVEKHFDMIHVTPPQTAPDFVRSSPLANAAGWIDVSPETLQHVKYANVFALGDVCSAPNAKTAAAVRAQAPVVAENIVSLLDSKAPRAVYNGYGSCPLTVERGKIVLAEFGYGGKLLPTFPSWLVDGTQPSRLAWFLKEKMLPSIYFDLMLRGKEWLMKVGHLETASTTSDAPKGVDGQAKTGKSR